MRFAKLLTTAKNVINIMKNGSVDIETNTLEFDLLDYYSNTNLSLETFFRIIKGNIPIEDYKLAIKTLGKYKNDKQLDSNDLKKLLDMKLFYITEYDEEGNVTKQYEITKVDKEQAIVLLNEKNLPITKFTYSLMLRKYVYNEVLKIDVKQLKRKK